jgi:VWFA-related protein
MTRLAALAGAIAIGATSFIDGAWRALPIAQSQPTFRARTDLVSVDVAVRDRNRPVMGLQPNDFEIDDNGISQSVLDVSYEKLPIDVTIALDVSQSVTGSMLNQLRRSIQELKSDLGAHDRLKLMTFNIRVRRLMDFTEDASAADAALAQVTAFGGTALLDTLAVALLAPVQPNRRHLIVLFSDGIDSSSITDPESLMEVAQRSTATVGFVLLALPPPIGASVDASRELYAQLARETGGTVVIVPMGVNLSDTFRRTLDEFRSSYVLHFSPEGVERSGVHTLDVRVKRKGVEVRARKGYGWR